MALSKQAWGELSAGHTHPCPRDRSSLGVGGGWVTQTEEEVQAFRKVQNKWNSASKSCCNGGRGQGQVPETGQKASTSRRRATKALGKLLDCAFATRCGGMPEKPASRQGKLCLCGHNPSLINQSGDTPCQKEHYGDVREYAGRRQK